MADSAVKRWALPSLLLAGCVGAGVWAVPTFMSAKDLQDGAQSSYSAPGAEPVAAVTASASLDASALTAKLTEISDGLTGGSLTGIVMDASTGEVLYASGADQARVPASNFKLLTDYTLMRVADPSARYTTSVTQQGQTLTLVAGGDTLLGAGESHDDLVVGHAGIRTLAQKTIQALEPGEYTLNLDASLYSGPAINSAWSQEDIDAGFVNNISPIAFYSHYSPDESGYASTTRPTDAAGEVQQRLLAELNSLGADQGMTFTLGAQASSTGESIASVQSATLAQQAAYMMQESDNMLAETLARNISVAKGGDGSAADAKKVILETLQADGISTDQLNIVDFSGLSSENRVTNTTLAELARDIVTAQKGTDPALAGLPVAGGNGTLTERFNDANEQAAQGYARAKTGTLNSVASLTGYTTTSAGQTLVFSFIANDVESTDQAKNILDQSVAAITAG